MRSRRVRRAFAVLVLAAATALVVTTVMVERSREHIPTVSGAADGRLVLPSGQEGLAVFGDSWTEGVAARPLSQGFAYLVGDALGVPTRVLGSGGTGYVTSGPRGSSDFPTRMRSLTPDPSVTLVVVQGGINDLSRPRGVGAAALRVVESAQNAFPAARVVVITPIPPTPEATGALEPLTEDITRALTGSGALVISPIAERWITSATSAGFLDPRTKHPTTAGHRYLASRIVADLRALA